MQEVPSHLGRGNALLLLLKRELTFQSVVLFLHLASLIVEIFRRLFRSSLLLFRRAELLK